MTLPVSTSPDPASTSPDRAVDHPGAAMAHAVDYPLYVVTASADGERGGCLAGFVTQCSILPPRYLVCISKLNHTFAVAERARALALHLLGESQRDMASLFGEETDDAIDKFARCDWRAGTTGVPILADCSVWVEGRVLSTTGVGDHQAFVLSVAAGGQRSAPRPPAAQRGRRPAGRPPGRLSGRGGAATRCRRWSASCRRSC